VSTAVRSQIRAGNRIQLVLTWKAHGNNLSPGQPRTYRLKITAKL
jgi:hypothetical protein